MVVSLRTRILYNLLLYTGLSYIIFLFIGNLTYSLIIHSHILALHIFICEVNGDCRYMKTREYIGHMLAIAALTFGVEVALLQVLKHELSFQSICLLMASIALVKGGIAYELKNVEV